MIGVYDLLDETDQVALATGEVTPADDVAPTSGQTLFVRFRAEF